MQKNAALLESARLSPTVPCRPLQGCSEESATKGDVYLFAFDAWVKLGFAAKGPFERKAQDFWHLQHPPELCGRLDDCRLLHLWSGCLELEQALHKVLVPDCGEFYRAERLPEILDFLGNVLEPLVLPEDPGLEQWTPRMLNCCVPERRHPDFRREEHGCRSFLTKGKTAPCRLCGAVVSVRSDKLKQHQRSQKCARGRE